jgi:hypothetical protein
MSAESVRGIGIKRKLEMMVHKEIRPLFQSGLDRTIYELFGRRGSAALPRTMTTMKNTKNGLSSKQRDELLDALKARFKKNMGRHEGLVWARVQARLEARPDKLWSLAEMELTGGEPDVVGQDKKSGEFVFMDFSAQSPKGRVSFCYDRAALDSRKEHKPKNCVLGAAADMGVEVLTEEEYFALQKLGEFDTKTSSWIKTPAASANAAVRCMGSVAIVASSWGTTVRSLTMLSEVSVAG